jgi:hypothetical protein
MGGRIWLLAQANVARQRAPLNSPVTREFVVALDPVNRIAEHSPRFIWRLRSDESHGATTVRDGPHLIFVNLSLWESYEALQPFAYRSPHGATCAAGPVASSRSASRQRCCGRSGRDERPTADEALRRLRYPQAHGPSPRAFTPRRRFKPDGEPSRRNRRR